MTRRELNLALPVPVIAEIAKPESASPHMLIAVARDGLLAMGLTHHAEKVDVTSFLSIEAARQAAAVVTAAYYAAGIKDWERLATRITKYLRIALDLRGAA